MYRLGYETIRAVEIPAFGLCVAEGRGGVGIYF